ncbi:methionine ABC transporter permease MetI [Silvanigrella paludirubra]|jgi:D-methionine transport system permease protein|uniref:Methionine ABC transporter permease MetI n=1 Tax=Silvanigrella paludirubra TaxID=2499159 RepID=A0A6N6VNX4_9BACT|nr:methionine ABC transporter permease [Silvanigrella paludirubra]KAB8036858.1 methionine ABC transporter permease MetI [Silvanigrella paludirubra]
MFLETLSTLLDSTLATIYMVLVAGLSAFIFGLPIAIALTVTSKGMFYENPVIHKILSSIVTIGRSVPFVILMVAIIPFTRFIVGTSIGTAAAMVPLSVAAIPFFARIVEGKLATINRGLIEAAQAMGSSPMQIIRKVLLPEAIPGIANACTILFVSLTEYSAMAGAVGGSGLGNMAIQYGYYQFNTPVMMQALVTLVALVLFIQFVGDFITRKVSH